MKRSIQEIIFVLIIALGIPGLVLALDIAGREPLPQALPITTQPSEPESQSSWQVNLILDGGEVTLPLEEYLVGVLLQELPESFSMEAKKAQATAARTYTMRAITLGIKHPAGFICGDHTCCQAYVAPDTYLAQGGDTQAVADARQAVEETAGQVIVYGDMLIDATYFACSGGRTEDAMAVWGADIPYLQSVASPGEEAAAHYTDTVQLSAQAFCDALGLSLSGSPATWMGPIRYTQGGGIDTMTIGGTAFTGVQLRKLLGLRSTALTLTAVGDTVTITTRGYGHRVGMSQQGANAMALGGSSYQQILTHYYSGTQIKQYDDLPQ